MAFPRDTSRFEESFTLQAEGEPGAIAEVTVELTPGQGVLYRWDAEETVEFNVHSHHGKKVTYHERLEQQAAVGRVESRAEEVYSLMWENRVPHAVKVRVELRR